MNKPTQDFILAKSSIFATTACVWIAIISLSYGWNWYQAGKSAVLFAGGEARASYEKDLVYRRWAALQGGVYIPPTEATPPNPYLSHLPDRDIVTTGGRHLTLVNPAYMTRQVHELGKETFGTIGHITSLRPLNPRNAADSWEVEALKLFAKGTPEIITKETINGEQYIRFMRPMITEKPCLKCHASQGYKEGEIRGGLSVSVPFASYAATAKQQQLQLLLAHALIAGFGFFALWKGISLLHSAAVSLSKSKDLYNNLLHTAMDGFWIVGESGQILDVNDTYCRMSGYSEQELLSMKMEDLEGNDGLATTATHLQRIVNKGKVRFETRHRRKDGTLFDVEVSAQHYLSHEGMILVFLRDITDQKQAAGMLTESHDLLNNLASLVPGVIYQYRLYADGHSAFPYASPGMHTIYEVSPEEVRDDATPVFGRLHPEDRERVTEAILTSAKSLTTFYCEFRVVLPKQGLRWRWSQAQPQRMEDGSTLWHGIISDITERKIVEEALKEREEDLRESQRIAQVGSWRLDIATNQVIWSDELYRMYGFDPEQPPPPYTEHQKLFAPESWQRLSKALQETKKTGIPYNLELETARIDGSQGWMWVHGMTVVNENGDTVGLRGVAQDITDRKRTEEALRKSEERLNFALAMNHTGGWDLDLNTNVSIRTLEHDRIFGYQTPLSTWTYDMFIDHVITEDFRHVDQHFHESIATHTDLNFECRIRRADGEIRWIWIAGSHLPEIPGGERRMAGIIQDITDKKRAEEEKEKLHTQLTQAQKMESVGRLAGGVAHDYNNMLGIIVGYSEMALENIKPNEPLHAELNEILNAANRSVDITRQLLAFSRQQAISPKRLNLNTTIEGMLKMLRRLIGEDIDLIWKPKANIRPVKMDPSQLDQVLVNLCVNARDAILDVGTITIETGMKTFDQAYCDTHSGILPGDYVALIVSDNGFGMTKDIQNKLFEPFFTTKELGKGTGLGLATVYGIVKQNNGLINIYSELGHGSSFKLYFPCDDHGEDSLPTNAESAPDAKGDETILLVEDDESILRMTETMLKRLGYHVISANKPAQAIEMARQYATKIDLLMTDVVMPEMNGRQLSHTIQLCHPDIRVLFMSGYTANVIAHHGVLKEGINFIQKPFTKKELAKKMREVFL